MITEWNHLTTDQKNDSRELFGKYEKLFTGKLGLYPHKKAHIEVEPNAIPVHKRPYAVPNIHLETFKKELDHLVEIGVFSATGMNTWESPTFIIPKKDGRVSAMD